MARPVATSARVPVEDVRAELRHLVKAHPLWNPKACVLPVTEAKEYAIELRALVSASNASTLWDLRCNIREGLVRFLQAAAPDHLPRTRAEGWTGTGLAGRSAETAFHARKVSEVPGMRF